MGSNVADRPPLALQQDFWNNWNAAHREHDVSEVSKAQAAVILSWLERVGRQNLDLIEIGCGAGWLCSELARFGHLTATDLSDSVLERAARRYPQVRFIAGDFMAMPFEPARYDVAIALEVLSHVAEQGAFLAKAASVLRPGGYLMLATQNRPALERNDVQPAKPGQLRHWVDRFELAGLLDEHFTVEELFSITPKYNRGPLRIVNSSRAKRALEALRLGRLQVAMIGLQERCWLGWTLMALARRRPVPNGTTA